MVDTGFKFKVKKAILIDNKPYDLYAKKEEAVFRVIKDFINHKNVIKIIVDIRKENPFSELIKLYKQAIEGRGYKLTDNVPLPVSELIAIMEKVPILGFELYNAKANFIIDCFKFMPIDYKKHYRYKWGLEIDETSVFHEEMKKFKDMPKDELRNYFLVFVKNISPMKIEKVERDLKEDSFLPIKIN